MKQQNQSHEAFSEHVKFQFLRRYTVLHLCSYQRKTVRKTQSDNVEQNNPPTTEMKVAGLVSQHDGLEGLVWVLQVVAPQALHEGRLLHVGDPSRGAHHTHIRGGGRGGEGLKGGVGEGWLEWAGVVVHGRGVGLEEERPWGSWVDKLFGIGGELAGDGASEGVKGERQRFVLQQFRSGDAAAGGGGGGGGGRAGEHPLGGGGGGGGGGGPAALLHFGGAKLGGGKAGGGEGDGLRTGRGRRLRRGGQVGNPAAGRRGGGVGGVGTWVRGRAGAGVAEEAGAGLGGERRGRAGERRQEGRSCLVSDGYEHLSVGVEAQTLCLLRLWLAFAFPEQTLQPVPIAAQAWGILQVEDLHRPLLTDLVGHLVRVDPHAELRGNVSAHFLRVQSASLGGQLHHGVPLRAQVDAAESRTPERRVGVPMADKAREQDLLQLLPKQVGSPSRQLVVQVGDDEVEGHLHLEMHGRTAGAAVDGDGRD